MALPKGTILENRYRIDHLLAQGGMGAIYRGFDSNLSIPVAIKENFFQTPHSTRQFQQEARILARLHHPNMPRVIHHFSYKNKQYLVMDFIEGEDLWSRVKKQGQPLDERLALDYLIQVCDAVDYLHRQTPPIIHRDIKPQNIKITPNGQAVLVDFGIAKVAETDSHTRTGAQGVTPGFSPPEQYSGEGTSPASDVYSLGATLYAVLTGKKPPHSISLLVDQAKFKPPAELNTRLSTRVSRAVMHAMQPIIENRPQSVAMWKQDLEAIYGAPTKPVPADNEATLYEVDPSPGWLVGPGGVSHQIRLGDQTLGRASTCDVYINDLKASRRHATLNFDGHQCFLSDAGSANGTRLNGQLVTGQGHLFKLGDSLQIGDTILLFKSTATGSGAQAAMPVNQQPVDELAGTAFIPQSNLPAPPPPSVGAFSQPVISAPSGTAKQGGGLWLWIIAGLVVVLLFVMGAIGFVLLRQNGERTTEAELEAIIAAAATATEQAKLGQSAGTDAEATLAVLAATVTEQAKDSSGPPVDTEATISVAIAATEHARKEAEPPTETPSSTRTFVPPTNTRVPFPTATPIPPLKTATFTPSPSPTVRPSATPIVAAPLGVFQNFENESVWKRGDEPNGEFSQISNPVYVYSGNYAGQLNYNFSTSGNDYVVFLQNRQLAGRPNAISAQIYGDGVGHFLNVWIKDAAGQSWQMSFGQVRHTGWQEMTAPVGTNHPWPSGHISGPDNGAIDYPVTFQGLVLDDGSDSYRGRGTIYIDNISSREGVAVTSTSIPKPVSTPQPISTSTPVISRNYLLAVAGQHKYETWGAPGSSDLCEAYRNGDFDDKIHMKGFNLELSLTNKSTLPVADDWSPTFTTAKGKSVQVCYYGYAGSGPPPGATSYMTFFTIVDSDDYVRIVRLEINGEMLQICLDPSGAQSSC